MEFINHYIKAPEHTRKAYDEIRKMELDVLKYEADEEEKIN